MDIRKDSHLWSYLSQGQRDLLEEGEYLLDHVVKEGKYNFKDYSFIVFPFAKAYEGYLKQLFLDVHFISEKDYVSTHFRLGKVMSPNLVRRLGGRSVYKKVQDEAGVGLADKIWNTWKMGRNQVFHYFPHNLRSLTLDEAEDIVSQIVRVMEVTLEELKLHRVKHRLNNFIGATSS